MIRFLMAPALAFSLATASEAANDSTKTESLEPVVVSASRTMQKKSETPMTINVIPDDVLQEANLTTWDQLMNQLPGVYMSDLGNEQHFMSIRQPISTKSLFLYLEDGLPIRPLGIFNHNALNETNMSFTERVEVVKGPSSAIYGSEAIGGAINLITKKPKFKPEGELGFQYDNQGYKRTNFYGGHSIGDLGFNIGGYWANRSDGKREHSDFNKVTVGANLEYILNDFTTFFLSGNYVDHHTDMTGSQSEDFYIERDFSSNQTFTYRDVYSLRLKTGVSHAYNSGSFDFTIYYKDNSIGQNPSYRVSDISWGIVPSDTAFEATGQVNLSKFKSIGALFQNQYTWNQLKIITGVSSEFTDSEYDAELIMINKNDQGVYTDFEETDSILDYYQTDIYNSSAYAQLDYKFNEQLSASLTGRYDYIQYNFSNNVVSSSYSSEPYREDKFSHFSPKAGVNYTPIKSVGVFANYSQGFIPPSVGDMYRTSGQTVVPDIDPAYFNSYELGLWHFINDKISIEASTYLMDGKDEIITVRNEDGSYGNANAAETRHMGLEFGTKIIGSKELSVDVSSSFSKHYFKGYTQTSLNRDNTFSFTNLTGNDMAFAPDWIINAIINYSPDFVDGLRFSFESRYLSEYWADDTHTARYPGHTIYNLRTTYNIGSLGLWANIYNMTDVTYATRASYSWGKLRYNAGLSRTFSFGIKYNFDSLLKNK